MMNKLIKCLKIGKLQKVGLLAVMTIIMASMNYVCVSEAKPQKEFNIGQAQILSGPASGWGIPMVRGVQIEVDKINAEGGIKIGNELYKIKFFPEDTAYSPQVAVTAAQKLVNKHKVKFFMGPNVSHTVLPMVQISTPAKIPNFACAWSNEVLMEPANAPYCFKTEATPHECYPAIYDYVFSAHPEVERVAEIQGNTASGRYSQPISIEWVKSKGKTSVFAEFYEPGSTKDFYPLLTRMLATKPDLVHTIAVGPAEMALIIKQSRELGYKGLFMEELPLSANFLEIAGKEACEGLINVDYMTFGPKSTPEFRDWRARYEKKYGEYDAFAPVQVLAFHTVLEAYQKAGTIDDPDKVIKILENTTFYPFGLETRFGDGGGYYDVPHQMGSPMYIMEVKNGVNTIVGDIPVSKQIDVEW